MASTHLNNLIKEVDIQNSRDHTRAKSLDQMVAYKMFMHSMIQLENCHLKMNANQRIIQTELNITYDEAHLMKTKIPTKFTHNLTIH